METTERTVCVYYRGKLCRYLTCHKITGNIMGQTLLYDEAENLIAIIPADHMVTVSEKVKVTVCDTKVIVEP